MSIIKMWIRTVWGLFSVSKQVSYLDHQIQILLKESEDAKILLDLRRKTIEDAIADEVKQRERIEKINDNLNHALQGAREKINILEEITIPGLIKALETYNAARDYQTATMAVKAAVADKSKGQVE